MSSDVASNLSYVAPNPSAIVQGGAESIRRGVPWEGNATETGPPSDTGQARGPMCSIHRDPRKSAVLSAGLGKCELRVVVYDREICGMDLLGRRTCE
jgi:hypothetical protein